MLERYGNGALAKAWGAYDGVGYIFGFGILCLGWGLDDGMKILMNLFQD